MTDLTDSLQHAVLEAIKSQAPLLIQGNGSKSFLASCGSGSRLSVSEHNGIIDYQPTELVMTARAGTPLRQIEATLAEAGQILPFEPPHFSELATFGGAIATGLSGPIRPYAGSARDFVLGCKIINGKGEILTFGGQVMKNVAGYDVSRLMVGAMGSLGILLEISIKVLPAYPQQLCLIQPRENRDALRFMRTLSSQNLPLTGLAYDGENVRIRLAGAKAAVKAASHKLGGEKRNNDDFWPALKEQTHPFFQSEQPLWRLSLPRATPWLEYADKQLIDWGGGLRWFKSHEKPERLFRQAQELGGHARLFRGAKTGQLRMQPLDTVMFTLQQKIKHSFDPHAIFNPGVMYPNL